LGEFEVANLKIGQKLSLAFTLMTLISVVVAIVVFINLRDIRSTSQWNDHTRLVLDQVDRVGAAMVDQETGVRGYLISNNSNFLEPYRKGAASADAALEQLTSLTADNAQQQARIATLKGHIATWRAKVAAVEISQMQSVGGAEAARSLEASGAGKKAMDGVRTTLGEMRDAETGLLAVRSAKRDQAISLGQVALIVSGLISASISVVLGFLMSRSIARPIGQMTGVMGRLAAGDLDAEVNGLNRGDEIGSMARAVQVFRDNGKRARALEEETEKMRASAETERGRTEAERRKIEAEQAAVVATLAANLGRLSKGDLTCIISEDFQGQYRQIKTDFNTAVESLKAAMTTIAQATGGIRGGSEEIAAASNDLSRRTEQQAASLEETAAALDQITATVKTSAEGAKQVSAAASAAKGDAERSETVMRDAVTAMSEISESSGQISQIIGVIDEIAFQTNLLALNAGVEAARAGEAGKGFAVVAQEVRALAQRSAEAAKDIKTLIASSSDQVERGVKLVAETGVALNAISAKVNEIDKLISEIARSSQQQATGLSEVNVAVNQMDQVTQQNAAMVEQATAAAASLKGEAGELERLVARFETGAGSSSARAVAKPQPARPAPSPRVKLVAGGQQALAERWDEF
jgi:methyl-accepting chemotaxis protein